MRNCTRRRASKPTPAVRPRRAVCHPHSPVATSAASSTPSTPPPTTTTAGAAVSAACCSCAPGTHRPRQECAAGLAGACWWNSPVPCPLPTLRRGSLPVPAPSHPQLLAPLVRRRSAALAKGLAASGAHRGIVKVDAAAVRQHRVLGVQRNHLPLNKGAVRLELLARGWGKGVDALCVRGCDRRVVCTHARSLPRAACRVPAGAAGAWCVAPPPPPAH